jgi:signal transduction histidine kinase
MRRSFGLRLTLAFAGAGLAGALVTAVLVNAAFGGRFSSYLSEQQATRERQLVATLADSFTKMQGWDPADLGTVAPLALMDGGTLEIQDSSGRMIWRASAESIGSHMGAMHRQMMGSGQLGPERRLPVVVDGTAVGYAVVRFPEAGVLPADSAFRSSVNRVVIFGAVVAGILALVLGLIFGRGVTSPVRDLTDAARTLASGDRSSRVQVRDERGEFGEMARAFNSMAAAVDEEDRLRRLFASDVAHEIRTPLAILRSQVEAIQDGVQAPTAETIASLHEEVLRLGRLTTDLETLASTDAAGFSLKREPVELGVIVREVLLEFAPSLEDRGIQLASQIDGAVIEGDEMRLHQVAANLMSNALKFTPAEGRVDVALGRDGRQALLRVTNTGPGIPPDELPHVFDRFFRGRDVRAGGSGIGLSVVRTLVEAHGGTVAADSRPDGLTSFEIRLPLASQMEHAGFTTSSRLPDTFGSAVEGGAR